MVHSMWGAQPGRALLVMRRLSVSKVARMAGVSRRSLDRALAGQRRPHPDMAEKVARALQVDKLELFDSNVLECWHTRRPL